MLTQHICHAGFSLYGHHTAHSHAQAHSTQSRASALYKRSLRFQQQGLHPATAVTAAAKTVGVLNNMLQGMSSHPHEAGGVREGAAAALDHDVGCVVSGPHTLLDTLASHQL